MRGSIESRGHTLPGAEQSPYDEIDMVHFVPEIHKDTFDERVTVQKVSSEEFRTIIEKRRSDLSLENIDRGQAYQYKSPDGQIHILLKVEGIPDQYVPYVEQHERWEAYAASPEGLNLVEKARNDLQQKLQKKTGAEITGNSLQSIFLQFINEYNFDYKHEYAILKEYQAAEIDGTLEEYHAFLMDLRSKDLKKYADDPVVVRKTENDIRIRESIFHKVTEGTPHEFSKKLSFGR